MVNLNSENQSSCKKKEPKNGLMIETLRPRMRAFQSVTVNPDLIIKRRKSCGEEGALAQLVERLNGIEEVIGSIPLCSTSLCFER